MQPNDADRYTGSVMTVGSCVVGATLLGGSFAGVAGALTGTVVGVILGIIVVRNRSKGR